MGTPLNRSVIRAFELLEVVAHHQTPPCLRRIATDAGMNLATTHRLLATLRAVGAVRGGRNSGFRLGAALKSLTAEFSPEPATELPEEMQKLSRRIGETVHLAVWSDDDMAMFVGKGESDGSVRLRTAPGTRLEAYCTAVGKAILSGLPRKRLNQYLDSGQLVPLTESTLSTTAALQAQLQGIRARGFALDLGEYTAGIHCIAVPVLDGAGNPVAALSASLSASRMTPTAPDTLAPLLRTAALNLARHVPQRDHPSMEALS